MSVKEKLNDLGIFVLYLLSPSGIVESIKKELFSFKKQLSEIFKPKKLSIIIFIIGCYLFLRLSYPSNKNAFLIALMISIVINLIPAYRGGEHRYWYKRRKMEKLKKIEKEVENL